MGRGYTLYDKVASDVTLAADAASVTQSLASPQTNRCPRRLSEELRRTLRCHSSIAS
jgi:hypothetical protein